MDITITYLGIEKPQHGKPVRNLSEWNDGHIAGAIHFEGGRIPWEPLPFPQDKPLAIQCGSGNRSMIAISVLKRRGIHNVVQVEGGITQWKLNGFEITPAQSKPITL